MSERLRIALTNPDLVWPRGAQRQLLMLAREWRTLGHDVSIVVGEKARPYAFDELLEGLTVETTGPWHAPLGAIHKLPGSGWLRARHTKRALTRAADALRAVRPDVVNAHNHPAQWTAGLLPTPHVWTCNEPPLWHYYPSARNKRVDPWSQALDAKLTAPTRAITVLDSRMAALVQPAYPGIPVHRTGSGCELPGPLPPRGAPPPAGIDEVGSGFHVVSVLGGLNEQKRPMDAVRALAAAGLRASVLHLVGAADDDTLRALHDEARRGGVALRHYAKLTEAQLLYLYANADAGVFLPENQPWGIFPLEALLAGIPVVVSDETGSLEVLPKGYPFVARVGDVVTAGKHLRAIADAPSDAKPVVEEARGVLRRDHSWAACATRVLDVVKGAL